MKIIICYEKNISRFFGPDEVKAHIKRMHQTSSSLCDQCGKVVPASMTKKHKLKHHGQKELKECKLCGVKLMCDMNRHMQAVHCDPNEKHVCHICGKKSVNFLALQKHIRYNHETDKKYECTLCDKKFKQKYNLKEHVAVHTGESLYNCPYCEWRFKSSANMHTHIKRLHKAEWEENRKNRKYSSKKAEEIDMEKSEEVQKDIDEFS